MIILDAFFRFTGIGFLLMLAGLTVVHHRKWKSSPYLVLSCFSIAALFLGFAPSLLRPTGVLYAFARFADVPHLVFVWLFALSLFQNNFSLKSSHILIGVLYSLPLLWIRLYGLGWGPIYPQWFLPLVSVLSLALMLHLCVSTLGDRADDLLDKRRASRIYFVVVIVSVTVISAASEPLLHASDWIFTTKIITIWPAIVWGFFWMTSFDQKAVAFADNLSVETSLSERDKNLGEKLLQEMTRELAFKEHDLTIVTLASRLAVNQHRLRSLINQTLGYKNFSEFVNTYRIDAVKKALSNPKNEHVSILALAQDSGFSSLSSFNRAFKNSEDLTPSEFRRSVRDKTLQTSK